MRALVTRLRPGGGREKVLVHDWPDAPAPGRNQVRTRTIYSGVANEAEHNDLAGANYARAADQLPGPLGYQNVGEVIESGPEVTTLRRGDLVFSASDHLESATFPEDWLVVRLRPNVDRRDAALFGMAGEAMRTCRQAEIQAGERVLVVGAGVMGQIAAQLAAIGGAEVTICDSVEPCLEIARQIGAASAIINTAETPWDEAIPDEAFEVVLDFSGLPGTEDHLLRAARRRGRVMLIAGRTEVRYTFNLGQSREITIRQNTHFDLSDLQMVHNLTAEGRLRISPLVQDVIPVDQAPQIYETLRDNPERLLGTVFVW
ncbi:MAG: threonine dehydrogenase-like Zn-dependent dehydrogenase [Armatimonadota bacterium]|nr:MAG: threonine dehydrogenase-like Zn-dependent dehydrogenase [Armatimonadota bacterium]